MKLLYAEDERSLSEAVVDILTYHKYIVDAVYNGEDAYDYAVSGDYDGIILDIMMPKRDGIEVLSALRNNRCKTPILLLTAKTQVDDRIRGLDAGADDYLTKPFSVEELLARLRSTLRRVQYLMQKEEGNASIFHNGELTIDYGAGTVSIGDHEIHLMPLEYSLLCLLAQNVGKVLTYQFILDKVWVNAIESDRSSLRVYMASLRKKIEKDKNHPQYIQTHIGVGYRMIRIS